MTCPKCQARMYRDGVDGHCIICGNIVIGELPVIMSMPSLQPSTYDLLSVEKKDRIRAYNREYKRQHREAVRAGLQAYRRKVRAEEKAGEKPVNR